MTASVGSLDYPSSLQEYAVSEQEYLRQHPEFDLLVSGAVVFNKEGKLLLVQRAADEKAFPNFWVSRKHVSFHVHSSNIYFVAAVLLTKGRRFQEEKLTIPTRQSYMLQRGS
jgi:isopentenyldiphosphate isomerase